MKREEGSKRRRGREEEGLLPEQVWEEDQAGEKEEAEGTLSRKPSASIIQH
jgi:hypothetical protein